MDQDVGKRLHSFPTPVSADALPTDHQVLLTLTVRNSTSLSFPLGPSVFSPNSDLGSCLHNVGKQQLPKAGVAWGSIIRKRRRFCCQLHEIGHPVTVFSTELQCCKKPTKCSFPEGGTAAERGHPTQSVWPKRRLLRTLCQIEEKFSWVKTSPYHPYL